MNDVSVDQLTLVLLLQRS